MDKQALRDLQRALLASRSSRPTLTFALMRQPSEAAHRTADRAPGRTGHVFQGRYKAILVEKDRYLLELARYVVLNPVRAGMVGEAGEWPWSSYRAMVG